MEVTVSAVTPDYSRRDYRVHVAISPLKNNDRFEWFIEKAVEIGIDEITPLICSRTEKNRIKRERLDNLILSAMKQSVKAYLPILNEPVTVDEFTGNSYSGRKLIAHCNNEISREPVNDAIRKGEDVVIMIGPEGDFTPEEVRKAAKAGFVSVHFGNSRLRTETAGVMACCSVYLTNLQV